MSGTPRVNGAEMLRRESNRVDLSRMASDIPSKTHPVTTEDNDLHEEDVDEEPHGSMRVSDVVQAMKKEYKVAKEEPLYEMPILTYGHLKTEQEEEQAVASRISHLASAIGTPKEGSSSKSTRESRKRSAPSNLDAADNEVDLETWNLREEIRIQLRAVRKSVLLSRTALNEALRSNEKCESEFRRTTKQFQDLTAKLGLPEDKEVRGMLEDNNSYVQEKLETPLRMTKQGVICGGALPSTNPYSVAWRLVGLKMVSRKYTSKASSGVPEKAFLMDLQALNAENNIEMRPRLVFGKMLDSYLLIREMLRVGGLRAVIAMRGFRYMARRIGCDDARGNDLKKAYIEELYLYENMLVFGKPPSKQDMKSLEKSTEVFLSFEDE